MGETAQNMEKFKALTNANSILHYLAMYTSEGTLSLDVYSFRISVYYGNDNMTSDEHERLADKLSALRESSTSLRYLTNKEGDVYGFMIFWNID